jgi:hypothetical protein
MNREPWVVYLVVIFVVAIIMYGKFLMSGGGDDNKDSKK